MTHFELIASVIGAVAGSQALVTLIDRFFTRRKVTSEVQKDNAQAAKETAEADAITTRATLELVAVLNTRINKLEADIETLRQENLKCRLENAELRDRIAVIDKKIA